MLEVFLGLRPEHSPPSDHLPELPLPALCGRKQETSLWAGTQCPSFPVSSRRAVWKGGPPCPSLSLFPAGSTAPGAGTPGSQPTWLSSTTCTWTVPSGRAQCACASSSSCATSAARRVRTKFLGVHLALKPDRLYLEELAVSEGEMFIYFPA